ncbi:hypothetical protein [Marinoscillum sp.]|uniref:hypothetical protein n=1 Tax=Marinoscillum sp. TaxID=2024838 RepID=UPI003BAB14BB
MKKRHFKKVQFKTSMVDYLKLILDKISFNRDLFVKEYRKGIRYLSPGERAELRKWLEGRGFTIQ